MKIILEDKKGYGRELKRVERADKRDRKAQRKAKNARRNLFTFA
jgi:hypothetical protein